MQRVASPLAGAQRLVRHLARRAVWSLVCASFAAVFLLVGFAGEVAIANAIGHGRIIETAHTMVLEAPQAVRDAAVQVVPTAFATRADWYAGELSHGWRPVLTLPAQHILLWLNHPGWWGGSLIVALLALAGRGVLWSDGRLGRVGRPAA